MSPSFDHPSNAIMSITRWQCIGLFTASLALTFVVAGSVNLMRNLTIVADTRPADPAPINVQLSSGTMATWDTGSGDPTGTEQARPITQSAPIEQIPELDTSSLPEIPSLTDLPEIPAPQPETTSSAPESAATNQESTSTRNEEANRPTTQTPSTTNNGSRNTGSSQEGSSTGTPTVQRLQFGVGAGRQPAPSYPRRALSRGHEGIVVVQFTVSESGNVDDARAVKPSRYPELNRAALSTIRRKWKFPAGEKRIYQISINFQIR